VFLRRAPWAGRDYDSGAMKDHPGCIVLGSPIDVDDSLPKIGVAVYTGQESEVDEVPFLDTDDLESPILVSGCGDCPFGHRGASRSYVCRLAEVLGEHEPELSRYGDTIPNGCPLPTGGDAIPVMRKP
jgi:hypothetical protein